MKKLYLFLTLFFVTNLSSQTIQFGIFNQDEEIIVRVLPSANYTTNDVLTDMVFTIRWTSSYGINLETLSTSYSLTKAGSETIEGSFEYQKFAFSGTPIDLPIDWISGQQYEVLRIPVEQIGTGTGTFELSPVGFLENGEGDPYIEINVADRTNNSDPFFQSSVSNVPLPVELSSFTASAKQNIVNLKWETKTEVNNFGFEVERLQDSNLPAGQAGITKLQDSEWEKIGFVQGNGNSNSPKDYFFTDKNPAGGSKFIYRLKQIDNDGKFEYSDEVNVELIPNKFELYQNYPNPFNPVTNIKFSLPADSKVKLDIYNIIGEHITTLIDADIEAGFYSLPFNAVDLASGTYIYRITAKDFSQTKKMLLIK